MKKQELESVQTIQSMLAQTKIRIHIGKSPEGNLSMIFADNGMGIPEEIPDRPDVEHRSTRIEFGGKISHMGRNNPIGRFGYGLSQSVLCLSDRAVVLASKCAGSSIRTCYYDLDELRNSDAKLPDEEVLDSIPCGTLPS